MSAHPWHEAAWTMLQRRLAGGSLPHALLLQGDAGLGKRAFADRLARACLCEQPLASGDACGHCRACALLEAGTHPDRVLVSFELNREKNLRSEIVVDQIRALSQRLAMASQFGGWQVALVDPADAMNGAAANALLKTLEEPSPQSLLILVADAPWRLPATIRSRCQRIVFHAPERAQALDWLREQGLDAAVAAEALTAAGDNPGAALAMAGNQGLPRRAEVLRDLTALRAGRADPWGVARQWLADEPDQRLLLAARELHRQAAGEAASGPPDLQRASDDFIRFNRAREGLRGPLRPELVLLDALAPLLAEARP
ncbi:MAG TPA: DNA polymerase III subunit delta' [Rhodanobacteraceae bacterium]|nr:DNA polymerase III subunit delta' [Rhodanobacteraceae bacterium]